MLGVVRIRGISQWNSTGKLCRYRLAQKHSARRAAERHASGVRPGTVAFVDGRAVLRGEVGRVHDVLGSKQHAVKRTAARGPVVLPLLRQSKSAVQMDLRLNLGFPCIDPLETGAYQSLGRKI